MSCTVPKTLWKYYKKTVTKQIDISIDNAEEELSLLSHLFGIMDILMNRIHGN